MNIINKLTLRHMKLNKNRTLVTTLGIIIAVAMITAVSTFGYSLVDYLVRNEMVTDGFFHLKFENYYYKDNEKLMEEMSVENYSLMKPLGDYVYEWDTEDENTAIELYKDDDMLTQSEEAFRIVAVSDNYYEMLSLQLISGDYPKNENELLLSELGNTFSDKKVGDKLIIGGKEYKVCGIIGDYEFERQKLSIPNVKIEPIYTKLDTNSLKDNDIVSSYVYVGGILDDLDESAENVKMKLKETNVPTGELIGNDETWYCDGVDVLYNYDVLEFYGIYDIYNSNAAIESFKLILITIIVIGAVSLIANGFVISISERNKYIGLLASVGATKKQKRISVYFEGFLEGIIAIPIGIVLGIGGIWAMLRLISPLLKSLSGTDTEIELVVSVSVILGAIFCSVLTIFLSARTPAKMASKISPIDAIRQNRDVKLSRKDVKTMGITKKIFGFEGELALKNLKRNKKRYTSTVVSMCISLSLFISVYSIIHYVKESICFDMQEITYDMLISSEIDSELQAESENCLKYAEEFEEVSNKILLLGEQHIENYNKYAYIIGGRELLWIDIKIEESMFHNDYADYLKKYNISYEGYQPYIITMNESELKRYLKSIDVDYDEFVEDIDNVILYDDMIRKDGLHDQYNYGGSTISEEVRTISYLAFQYKNNDEYIEGGDIKDKYIKHDIATGEFNVFAREEKFVGLSVYESFVLVTPKKAEELKAYGLDVNYYLALEVSNDKAIEDIYSQILDDNLKSKDFFDLSNLAEDVEQIENAILLISILVYSFIILMTLICVSNIINTISTSVALRRREFSMLKSVGMTNRQFNRMIAYESIFYGLKAVIYGLPFGIGVSLFARYLIHIEYSVDFSRPWFGYIIAIAGVFVIIGLTMFYSSRKIKKANIIEALRDENA